MIVWDESMSTGIAIVDEQHKLLFQTCNEFSTAMSERVAKEAAGEVLDFLQFYVTWHFRQEEQYMAEAACPVAVENKQAHTEFITTLVSSTPNGRKAS